MADIPGLQADVFFGDADNKPLPNWRKEISERDDEDDEDKPLSKGERAALVGVLGFDPEEIDSEVKESRDASGHEHASDGKFGTGSGTPAKAGDAHADLHAKAEKLAGKPGTASKILRTAGKIGAKVKEKTKALYSALEGRYGRRQAIAIFAAGHVLGLASPLAVVPGSTMLGMVPFAALAEVYLQAKRGVAKLREGEDNEPETLTQEQIEEQAKKLLSEIKATFEDAKK